MTVFTDPGTGTSLKVGARQVGDTVNVFAEIAKSPDNGTFQTAYLSTPGEDPQAPRDVGICGLWGEWSLSVSWTMTTYVDGQKVSEESGGYSRAGGFTIPGTVSSDQAPAGLWKQMGFSNASHGAREIAMEYRAPSALMAGQPVRMVIHVTRPGQNPVTTVPFSLLMSRTPNGLMFQQAPDEECPAGAGASQVAATGDQGTPSSPGTQSAAPEEDPCEKHLNRARDRLESRQDASGDSGDALRDKAAQEARLAREIASDAGRARYDLDEASRRAEDAQREADFRQGLLDKFGPHQKEQTGSYGELADSARQMGDSMEARAAEAERRAANWDQAAERYDRIAETTDDPSLAEAARQAADNAREDASKLRDAADGYRKEAKEDYDRGDRREQAGDRIQADTDRLAQDAQDAAQAAADARALEECLKRVVAELEAMAAAQAQAAEAAAQELAEQPPPPPASAPATQPPPPAASTPASGPCPGPAGKISAHMVDAEVYTAWLYGNSDTFTDLADIVAQLQAKVAPNYDPLGLCGRCIQQLDVWGHGDTGGGYISFGPNDAQIGDTPLGTNFDQNLGALGALMCVGGKVVINQCKAGTGNKGTLSLQALADKIGVPVSGPTDSIKGCRIFGGALTGYKDQTPGPGARTPDQNKAGPVSVPAR
jgi:hypothetical protein